MGFERRRAGRGREGGAGQKWVGEPCWVHCRQAGLVVLELAAAHPGWKVTTDGGCEAGQTAAGALPVPRQCGQQGDHARRGKAAAAAVRGAACA